MYKVQLIVSNLLAVSSFQLWFTSYTSGTDSGCCAFFRWFGSTSAIPVSAELKDTVCAATLDWYAFVLSNSQQLDLSSKVFQLWLHIIGMVAVVKEPVRQRSTYSHSMRMNIFFPHYTVIITHPFGGSYL